MTKSELIDSLCSCADKKFAETFPAAKKAASDENGDIMLEEVLPIYVKCARDSVISTIVNYLISNGVLSVD